MSDLLINAGVFGVLIPAAAAGAAGVTTRFRALPVAAMAGLGVGGGVWMAASRLAGTVPWPPVDAAQWVPVAALLGAALGVVVGPASELGALRTRPVAAAAGRALLFAGLAVWTLTRLLASLSEHLWDAAQASREIWRLTALGTLGYAGLDALFEVRTAQPPERRLRAFVTLAAAGVALGGAAAIVALSRSALLGQLLGAVAAALGGLALATLAGARREALRSAAPALALALLVVVAAAQHYASLPANAAIALLLAPGMAALAVHLAPQGGPGWSALGGVATAGLVLGVTGGWTHRVLGAEDAAAASASPGEPELDYGYGSATASDDAAADSATDDTPDPYADPRLKEWKPPE